VPAIAMDGNGFAGLDQGGSVPAIAMDGNGFAGLDQGGSVPGIRDRAYLTLSIEPNTIEG